MSASPADPGPERDVAADDLVARLLALITDELGAEVTLEAAPASGAALHPVTPPFREIATRGQDGVVYGRLLVLPVEGAGTAVEELALGDVIARLVGERLERRARDRSVWEGRVSRVRDVLTQGALVMRYQPVLALRDGSVLGVEALATFPEAADVPPERWFADAEAVGLGVALEISAIAQALEALESLAPPLWLAVNISPATAASPALAAALEHRALDRLVFEITEHAEVTDYDVLNAALRPLRARGLRLAVDDAGAGFASLRHILQMGPDIIKLDRTLVSGMDRDPVLRALTYSIASFASATDAVVVAEGIETQGELNALRFLGIESGQGYHLCRPGPLAEVLALRVIDLDELSRSSAG